MGWDRIGIITQENGRWEIHDPMFGLDQLEIGMNIEVKIDGNWKPFRIVNMDEAGILTDSGFIIHRGRLGRVLK